jgi:hypothetical protein
VWRTLLGCYKCMDVFVLFPYKNSKITL